MKKKIVLALGGNALGNTPQEQMNLVKKTAKTIVNLIEEGYEVIIGHGNGPQVGMINLAMEYAASNGAHTPNMPFAECGSMSQGYIGYHLQQSIRTELKKRNIDKDVVTIITEVIVDKNDKAFENLSKPIGAFCTKEEANKISREKGYTFIEDAGRGYRRVVASPKPQKIVELRTIEKLIDQGVVVITVGGGGIPVIEDKEDQLTGVDAVIDKDMSCSKLASDLNAYALVILTAVDKVYINFGKENQKAIDKMNVQEAQKYIQEGQFAKGSMLPKVQACMEFVDNKEGKKAIIAALEEAELAIQEKTGTQILFR